MIPTGTRSVFKSRWMALVWAAGILVVALEVAGSPSEPSNASENAAAPTDVTGAPITPEDENQVEQALNSL